MCTETIFFGHLENMIWSSHFSENFVSSWRLVAVFGDSLVELADDEEVANAEAKSTDFLLNSVQQVDARGHS